MSLSKSLYASEVLGVNHYLCPPELLSVRRLKGKLPCDLLVVVYQNFSHKQESLLKKIMSSIRCSDYSVLIVKQIEALPSLMGHIETQKLAQRVCFFGQSLQDYPFKHTPHIKTHSLEELEGETSQALEKKKKLWESLKLWRK